MAFPPGTRFGPYEIVSLLGAGGMGEVYKATDRRLGRTVAIKTLASGHGDRFSKEARAIAALTIRISASCTTSGLTTWSWNTSRARR